MTDRHPLLAYPQLRYYLTARLAATLAQNSLVVVIGWQVYDLARQTMDTKAAAFQLGMVGLVQFMPLLLLSLVVGWTADRLDRRWIARAAIALEVVCGVILAVANIQHVLSLPILFGVAALLGVARAFAMPALQALAPNLVPPEALPRTIALSSIAWQIGAVMGPATGGYLYAIGHATPYVVSAALFALRY